MEPEAQAETLAVERELSSETVSNGFWAWLDERLGLDAIRYPVPAYSNTIYYTLGGITLGAFLILGITGFYLTQYYHPHPAEARDSIIYVITQAQFGDWLRSLHYWAANLMVVTLSLHLFRVFLTRAYRRPRELNWAIGTGLLVITVALFFTGTVLKWDQEAYEALAHSEAAAGMLGQLGAFFTAQFTRSVPLLTRLYAVHVAILPAFASLLALLHLLLVKRHGISPLPGRPAEVKTVAPGNNAVVLPDSGSTFNLHVRQIVGYSALLAAVAGALALAFPAGLGSAITPGIEVTKPSWIFWWLIPLENWWGIQSLLWVAIALPALLLLVPFVDRGLKNRRWLLILGAVLLVIFVALAIYGRLAPVGHTVGGA